MDAVKDPFEVVVIDEEVDEFARLRGRPVTSADLPAALPGAATARLQDFDLDEQPLLVGLPQLAGERVRARTIVSLRHRQIGSTVVVLFEQGDVRRPIVIGIVEEPGREGAVHPDGNREVLVEQDDERLVLRADREISLRCGAASITLTRAGKVIIKGAYVISRSSGCNKIKGAAVEIN